VGLRNSWAFALLFSTSALLLLMGSADGLRSPWRLHASRIPPASQWASAHRLARPPRGSGGVVSSHPCWLLTLCASALFPCPRRPHAHGHRPAPPKVWP